MLLGSGKAAGANISNMNFVNVRVRAPDGAFTLTELINCSLKQLKITISSKTGIAVGTIKLLHGFPPVAIDDTTGTSTLADHNIRSGDIIIVGFREPTPDKEAVEECSKGEMTTEELFANSMAQWEKEVSDAVPNLGTSPYKANGDLDFEDEEVGEWGKKLVPRNNMSLFQSMGFILTGKTVLATGALMKANTIDYIIEHPTVNNKRLLGDEYWSYCAKLLDKNYWPGETVLKILSEYQQLELAVVNIGTGELKIYGKKRGFPYRSFIILDGIHYYAIYLTPDGKQDTIRTKFPPQNRLILDDIKKLANEEATIRKYNQDRYRRETCEECQMVLHGSEEIEKHITDTGHLSLSH